MINNKRRMRKYLGAVLVSILVGVESISAYAVEEPTGYIEEHPIYENNLLKGLDIDENSASARTWSIRRIAPANPYDTKYDPRESGGVPSHIEDQGQTDTCWAFSTIAAIECNLIKNGYADSSINLSENQLAYFFYNRQTDVLGGTENDQNIAALKSWDQNGGTIQGTAEFLTTGVGLVADDRTDGSVYEPKDLTGVDSYFGSYRIKDTYLYNYSVENVKKAISEHGAVVSGIYINNQYWNFSNGAYYCPAQNVKVNHAVSIVGWDDNYSKDNFNENIRPSSDGAWIVRNSYGKDEDPNKNSLHDGYLYVSYEDASLSEIVAYEAEPNTDLNIYQYDGSANPVYMLNGSSEEKFANVFVVQGTEDDCNEMLKEVSIGVLSTQVLYQVEIYAGIPDNGTPDEGVLLTTQSGTLEDAGSHRISLDTPVVLIPGERYAVVFTVGTHSEDGTAKIMADRSNDFEWIRFEACTSEKESYYYGPEDDSEECWKDMSTDGISPRIKAYTEDINQKTILSINMNALEMKTGGTANLSAEITTLELGRSVPNDLNRKINWTSSDEKVVTVEDGTVTATGAGKATVTASIGNKTAFCEVTVAAENVVDEEEDITPSEEVKKPGKQEDINGSSDKITQVSAEKVERNIPYTGDPDEMDLSVYSVLMLCAAVLFMRVFKRLWNEGVSIDE